MFLLEMIRYGLSQPYLAWLLIILSKMFQDELAQYLMDFVQKVVWLYQPTALDQEKPVTNKHAEDYPLEVLGPDVLNL
jgi:hypothetical protein